jgi:molybdopterin synthase sulfur carrier subunit
MPFDLLWFGGFRESVARDRERIDPPSHVLTVGDLTGWLAEQGAPYASVLADRAKVRAAVDTEFAGAEDSIFGAREVALFPPVGALGRAR